MAETFAMTKVILFVHGLSGSGEGTWGGMIELFRRDRDFSQFQLDTYQYPTAKFRLPFGKKMPGIQELAEGLKSYIDTYHENKTEIILVGHSLGGLVLRKYILNELKNSAGRMLRAAIMIATPHTGSSLARLGASFSWRHSHLKQLSKGEDVLNSILEDWAILKVEERISTLYVVGGIDAVVERSSSMPYFGGVKFHNLIGYGHVDVIKPEHANDMRFLVLKQFVEALSSEKKTNVVETSSVGWPLFYRYELACEDFYFLRVLDQDIDQSLTCSNLWLSGPAGVGKTVALTRAILLRGWQLLYFSLDGFYDLPADELLKELCRMLLDRVGISDDCLSNSCSVPEVLRCFSLAFSASKEQKKIAVFIEEIPITSELEYSRFLGLAYHLSMVQDLCGSPYGVVWVFSSIIDPTVHIRPENIKLQERYEFLRTDVWTDADIGMLFDLLCGQLELFFSESDKQEILRRLNNSPRYLKMFFKARRTEYGSQKAVSDLISSISMAS